MKRIFCLGFVAALAALAPEAQAQVTATVKDQSGTHTVQISDTQAAQLLINAGKPDDAKKLLEADLKSKPDDSETLFLLGTIAVAEKDYDTAIDYYRRILVNEPDAERVRLELARAFFLKGDYDNARMQFQRARAGDVPDTVKSNIDQFLAAINRNKEYSLNFSVALAPDTNENAATGVSQINLYGLPFTLDSTARQTSGVGVFADVGGEYSPLINQYVKARLGVDAYRTEYGGGAFDDMTISTYAGPQFLFPDWDISPLVTGFQRWYGNKLYLKGVGGRLTGDYGITSAWQVSGSFGGQAIFYKSAPTQSGPLYSSQIQVNHALSPSSAFQVQVGYNRQLAEDPAYAYNGYYFGGGYQQDLPYGFSANFQPTYYITDYDSELAGFGAVRADRTISLHLEFLNRRFSYRGFTPKISYTFTDQQSNIPLYSYTRNQFQIGITSQF